MLDVFIMLYFCSPIKSLGVVRWSLRLMYKGLWAARRIIGIIAGYKNQVSAIQDHLYCVQPCQTLDRMSDEWMSGTYQMQLKSICEKWAIKWRNEMKVTTWAKKMIWNMKLPFIFLEGVFGKFAEAYLIILAVNHPIIDHLCFLGLNSFFLQTLFLET